MAELWRIKRGLKCIASGAILCQDCVYNGFQNCKHKVAEDAISVIEELQEKIAQLQPKKGHWEMKEDPFGLFDEIPVCSVCECTNDMRKKTAFCEHCGADMREGDGNAG